MSRASRMHCDFAFYAGATRENTKDLGELEMLPGVAGVKVFMGSSTGSLLIEDDDGVRAVLKAIRRRAAFHSEDEYRLRERLNLRVEGDARSPLPCRTCGINFRAPSRSPSRSSL